MVPAADGIAPATQAPELAARPAGLTAWLLRAVVSVHLVAIAGQPVFAGVFLSGDFDGLRWHAMGADAVSYAGLLHLAVAGAAWIRLRLAWPFLATAAVLAAETVQYLAGLDGALWLHLPLGVATVAAVVVLFIAIWRHPLRPRPQAPAARAPRAGRAARTVGTARPARTARTARPASEPEEAGHA